MAGRGGMEEAAFVSAVAPATAEDERAVPFPERSSLYTGPGWALSPHATMANGVATWKFATTVAAGDVPQGAGIGRSYAR